MGNKIIHRDKMAADHEMLTKYAVEEKLKEQGETLTVLDSLRRSRSSRGGGPPLEVPQHLKQPIIFTDDDIPLSKKGT